MSYARHNRDLKKLTPGDRLGAALNAKRLNALAELAQAAAMGQNVRGGPGVRVRSGPGGVTITSTVRGGRGGGGSHPFKCPATTDGTTASTVVGGTVNGVSATNLSLTISATGTKYVYLDVTYTQDLTSNNYVQGFSGAITCALATGSSVPADSSTHLYRQIAKYVDGVKTEQNITSSMEVVIRDDGSGTSTTVAIWGKS